MVDLDEFQLAKLAREMAMNIRPYKAVFEDFGIDENDYYIIEKIEFYKKAKEQFTLEWNSTLSSVDRVRLISAAYSEQLLPTVTKRALRETTPFSDVIDAAKYLARNAGIGEPKAGPPNTERFVIQINLGADTEIYDKSIAIDTTDIGSNPKAPTKVDEGHKLGIAETPTVTQEDSNGQADDEAEKEIAFQFIRASRERGGE